ncbi:MAG: diadenylate cyclase, partial [Myxococcota bacterium]|nr:diadenylate cyclase [Myxococcota bacterium]
SVYLVLAVIILFQEDIRKGLAKAGALFPSIQKDDLPAIEEVIKVSFFLAKRRQGALIAIERRASLTEYVETATQLDAKVNIELLQAIFLPNSPLHDGAIIIQKNRIASAQSYLPLSTSKNIHKWYGTRHRAAIGLTEMTDAIVVVVSEERGTVAMAQNGHLNVLRDSNEMRQAIYDAFKQEEEADNAEG